MDIMDTIEKRLTGLDLGDKRDIIMRIIRDETRVIRDIASDEIEMVVQQLNPDKVNVVYVNTGMIPRTKAEKHMRDVVELFKNAKSDSTQMLFLSYNNSTCPVIHKLDKGTPYIIQLDVSMMPIEKVKSYMSQQRELIGDLLPSNGYDIELIGVRADTNFNIYEKVDC